MTTPMRMLPDNLQRDITVAIAWYSIGIVATRSNNPKETPRIIGSGTLISHNRRHYLLTAQHVTAGLNSFEYIGFCLDEDEMCLLRRRNLFSVTEIGTSESQRSGPDLSIMHIPENVLGSFLSKKSAYNVALKKEGITSYGAILQGNSYWGLFGVLEERTETDNEAQHMIMKTVCYGVPIPRFSINGEFDYFEVDVDFAESPETPHSFGGMSGGGLWGLPLKATGDSIAIDGSPILVGIPFYESQQDKIVRGHGPLTIYDHLIERLQHL